MSSSNSTQPTSIATSIFAANAYLFAAANTQAAFYSKLSTLSFPHNQLTGRKIAISTLLFLACLLKSRSLRHEIWLNTFLVLLFLTTTANTIVHLQFFRLVLVEHSSNPKYAHVLDTPFHIVPNLLIGLTAVLADGLMVSSLAFLRHLHFLTSVGRYRSGDASSYGDPTTGLSSSPPQ
jgi:hypothetical protein